MKKIILSVLAIFSILLVTTLMGCSNTPTGFGIPNQQSSFSGEIFYNNKVDILFVVDDSKSMLQYQQRLSNQMQGLVSTLNTLGMDYRVAVTTSTMAKNSPSYPQARQFIGSPVYLTAANINLLADRIVVGESGSDLERSLDAMAYVTSTNYLASIKSDFIRSDALLSIIFISDEKDMSSEFGNPDKQDFVNYLNSRKPAFSTGGMAWLANYIGILSNQNCDILGGTVSIGTQFLNLVEASGGIKSSICNPDLSLAVSNIKARIIDQITAYRFLTEPNKSTISVVVGGRTIFEDAVNGWTLESEILTGTKKYLLKFHGLSIPAARENVDVKFKPAGVS